MQTFRRLASSRPLRRPHGLCVGKSFSPLPKWLKSQTAQVPARGGEENACGAPDLRQKFSRRWAQMHTDIRRNSLRSSAAFVSWRLKIRVHRCSSVVGNGSRVRSPHQNGRPGGASLPKNPRQPAPSRQHNISARQAVDKVRAGTEYARRGNDECAY